MLLKIALNGARPKSENENIPHSPDEIEKEVRLLYSRGYKTFHIHCYDKEGRESLKQVDVHNLVSGVKNISADIRVGISTGDWIEPDLEKRKKYISDWKTVPDFASVNMIEANSIEICQTLMEKGITVEAGLNEMQAAEILVNSRIREGFCRILIEPEPEELSEALQTVNEIESVLNSNDIRIKRLLHGFNAVSWDLLREAKKRGYDGRMGMEDTIFLENGIKVKSNLELINAAEKIIMTA